MDRVPENSDWRLQGQERHLTGAQLKWRAWMQLRVDWDHDHCEFCWAKFGPAELAHDSLTEGWSTAVPIDGSAKSAGPTSPSVSVGHFVRDGEVHCG